MLEAAASKSAEDAAAYPQQDSRHFPAQKAVNTPISRLPITGLLASVLRTNERCGSAVLKGTSKAGSRSAASKDSGEAAVNLHTRLLPVDGRL